MQDEQNSSRLGLLMRRQPVQARGAATVTAILDACEALLTDRDYDSVTTARIAESAGIPIGSFYQYFPDKRSVVRALALRGTERLLAEVEQYFDNGTPEDWRETVVGVLAVYDRIRRRDPSLGRVGFVDMLDNHLVDPEEDHHRVLADQLGALFATRYRIRRSAAYKLAFQMAVESGGALLRLAERGPARQRKQLIAGAQEVVVTVLAKVLDQE
ncbi:TetR/AcrR family transcriptional regulator [Kutzneria viridogrisea]|uniref:TetR/AcrR family transcriptional regulator n=1 Tax=Kutzneria TaxID=43356 RepID=UPI0004B09B88|nr:TetR/AcrR family transcriptional regulator [Kutzneria albida]